MTPVNPTADTKAGIRVGSGVRSIVGFGDINGLAIIYKGVYCLSYWVSGLSEGRRSGLRRRAAQV